MSYFVDDIKQLQLEVYTIGYPLKGESQVIFLKNDKRIIFSCVIDCYAENNKNSTFEILRQNKITFLDFFIWTHTDEDHSVGIDTIIDNFCTPKTMFVLPEGITGNEKDFVDYNDNVKLAFSKINLFNTDQNYCVNTATVAKDCHSRLFHETYSDTSNRLNFEIIAIAPISAIVRRRWESGLKKKNDVSIATIFRIGQLSLLFGGDIENQSIRLIPNHYFSGLSFIKIPHHTSKSASELICKLDDVFDKNVSIATTTVFDVHNLPDDDLINKYKRYVDNIFSTGKGKHPYGYIKTIFDIFEMTFQEECYGNAQNV